MKTSQQIAATATLGLLLAGGTHAGAKSVAESGSTSEPYRYVVSVGCAPPNGRTVAYVWHEAAVTKTEFDRVFKELAAGDFEDCLSEIAKTESGLYELLVNLGPQSGEDVTRDVMKQAMGVWSRYGVYDAIEEVAETGMRGPKIKALLHTCSELQEKREGGAEGK